MATRKRPRVSDPISEHVAALRAQLAAQGNPARAAQEKRYLKSELEFLGVGMPALRKTAKAFVRAQPDLGHDTLLQLVAALWEHETHELRAVAVGILELEQAQLTAADLPALIALVRKAKTWALVDWLATKVIGPLSDVPKARKHIDAWARDDDFWVRRTALLAHHDKLLRGTGDFDHFARLAEPMLDEREFFIRKAIGWVLRSTAKRTPQRTYAFVEKHARELSGLSFREAVRALPAAQQKKLIALRERS
ncbi:MAG TPA: DNA alkylation repair protein [Polyangiales bacterium]|nr:DNA alkylation repair protein [Polyangiales bacterium]